MLPTIWADDLVMTTIRQADERDLPLAASLWQDRIALLQQTDSLCRPTPESRAQWLACAGRWLDDDRFAFYVATVEQVVAGYIVVSITEGVPGLRPKQVGNVVDMAVELHRSHPGLSAGLLDHAQAWLRARHIDLMTIDVPAFYPVESAFWRARGGQQRFVQHWIEI